MVSTFPGEGIVEPQSEVIILSPASSIIKEILKEVGSHVNEGEPIIILDPSPIQSQIENIQDQLEMKQNSLRKNHLNARSTKFDKTKQELELAEQDLVMLKEKNAIKLEQLEADEEGLRLQIEMQEKDLATKQEALSKMIIRAPSAGIILSIRGKVGEKVDNDRLLIEMSDLTSFKIQGKVDDDYSEVLKTGTKVYVSLDNEQLTGFVGTVNPAIRDRKIEFDVNLRESNNYKLRPNLNVDLAIVREEHDSVLRIQNGPALGRGKEQQVYVLENGKATLREIEIGMRTEEYVEVLEGLSKGERVVLSVVSSVEDLEAMEREQ